MKIEPTLLRFVCVALLLGILSPGSFAQGRPSSRKVFTSAQVGFRFLPPPDLLNIPLGKVGESNFPKLLLLCRSNLDNTVPDWRSLSVETYPRQAVDIPSDFYASMTIAKLIIGPSAQQMGKPTIATIAAFNFVISQFQLRDVRATKYGRIYVTILNGKILSFAFAADSTEALDKLASSLTTIKRISPIGRKHPSHGVHGHSPYGPQSPLAPRRLRPIFALFAT